MIGRLLAAVQGVLLSDTTVGWVDALLLCLGLTCTIASALPALRSIRRHEEDSETGE